MTNSTDKPQETDKKPKKQKKPKKKGPLRMEAIIPVVVIVVLIGLYFSFFFDSNLRSGITWVGSRIHGAEINIASLKTSFIKGNMLVTGIEVTNREKPEENLVQIGKIRMGLLWDALLRAKFVVPQAGIEDIAISAKRKSPGRVFKSDDPSREGIAEFEKRAYEAATKEYDKNVLGDLAAVAGGADPNDQLKTMQQNLGAEKKMNALKEDLTKKEKAWKERIAGLPGADKFKALETRFKSLKFDDKNTVQFLKDIQEADKILKEADQEVKKLTSAANELNGEVNTVGKEIGQVDKWIQQDIADIQSRLKIPDLNLGNLSKSIFLGMLQEKIAPYQKYITIAKEYMPPPKTPGMPRAKDGQEPLITPKKRGQGKTYKFPITAKSYPLFWLQEATISSKSTDDGFSGDVSGTLKNFTTNPGWLGKPATVDVDGDFPTAKIMGLKANMVIDNRKTPTNSTLKGSISSFPMEPISLSDSKDLKFKMNNLVGRSAFNGSIVGDKLAMKILNKYDSVEYDIDSGNKDVKQLFTNAAAGIGTIDLKASVKGTLASQAWAIDSNLGRELGKNLKKQIQAKIDQAKKQIEAFVYGRVGKEKKALESQYATMKSDIDKKVNETKKQVDTEKKRLSADLNQKKKANEKKGQKKIEKKGKDLLKDLKKKFKF